MNNLDASVRARGEGGREWDLGERQREEANKNGAHVGPIEDVPA